MCGMFLMKQDTRATGTFPYDMETAFIFVSLRSASQGVNDDDQ
jgi:hypothetical protein